MKIGQEDFGVAFTDPKLKELRLYPVISNGVQCTAKFIDEVVDKLK